MKNKIIHGSHPLLWVFLLFFTKLNSQSIPFLSVNNKPAVMNRTLDVSKPVGVIKGSFDVTNTGASAYTIPVDIAPGTNGMKPDISINYSSQAGMGELGFGWSIGGVSSITRVNNNFFHDGNKKEVRLDATDKFALDGQRLIGLTGVYGQDQSTYAYEEENFSRLKSHGASADGPDYFEMITPDNKTITFGGGDANMKALGSNVTCAWRISKIRDIHGNYIEFHYASTSGIDYYESYLSEIHYTGNDMTGLNPYNKIKFIYNTIWNKEGTVSYLKGYPIHKRLILKSIESYAEGVKFNELTFEYFINEFRPEKRNKFLVLANATEICLKEVRQIRSGQEVNSTLIDWGARKDDAISKSIFNFNVEKKLYKKFITGDFNGDGKTDYLALYYDDSDMDASDFVSDRLYICKENSQFDMVSENNLAALKIEVVGGSTVDYNNDGDEDIYLIWRDQSSSHGRGNVFEYNPMTKKLDRMSNHLDFTVLNVGNLINYITCSAGELNGDGNMDMVIFQPDINNSIKIIPKVELLNSNNQVYNFAFRSINPTSMNSVNWTGDVQAFLTDFNGNGITELTIIARDKVKNKDYFNCVEIIDGKSNYLDMLPNIVLNPKDDNYMFADFSGDGKTDMVLDAGGNIMQYYISNGVKLTKINKRIILSNDAEIASGQYNYQGGSCSDIKSYMTIGDYNGDGKSDILVREMKLVDAVLEKFDINYMVNYGTGEDFAMESMSVWGYGIQFDECDKFNHIYTGDFNGDAKTDILFNHLNGEDNIITHFRADETRLLVKSILDGHNNKIGIDYQTLSHRETSSNVYNKTGANTSNSVLAVQGPMYVVSSIENPNGIGGKAITTYQYNDLLVHPKGRGMIGFREVIKNFPNGTTLKTNIELDDHFFVPQILRSEMSSSQHGVISTSTESYSINENGLTNGRYIKQLLMDVATDQLAKTETVKSYVYHEANTSPPNARYLPTKETHTIKDLLNGTVQSTKVIELEYENYLNFMNAKVKLIREERSKLGDPLKDTRVQERIYDSKGMVLTEIENSNKVNFLTKQDFTYNSFGLMTHKYLTADGKVRHQEYVYDPNYRFVILDYNHNLSPIPNEFLYDATTGLKTMEKQSSINPNEFTITEYDVWNRPIKKTEYPYGLTNTIEYLWSSGSGISLALYEVKQTKDNAPNEINYLDAQGRVLLKKTESLNGNFTNVAFEFDEFGKVIKQSNPYYNNETPIFVYAKYDLLGRKTEDWNDCGQHTIYTYDDFTNGLYHQNRVVRTVDASGREKKVTNDALGKIILSEDLGGKIEFKYNCFLEPYEIVANGMKTSFEYDEVGNRIKISEPNAGIRESRYNAMGFVIWERDSKGNTIDYLNYDDMGRVLQKRIYHAALNKDETILYRYNQAPGSNGFGQIERAESSFGTSTEYKYTANGELESTIETIKGKLFETKNIYDPSNGNLAEIIYPSGYHVYNSYDKTGQIIVVGDGSKVLYQLIEEDAMGRERSVKWAPNSMNGGVESTTSYTTCNEQVQQSATKMTSPIGGIPSFEVFYNIGVVLDPIRGNVIQRVDNVKGLTESFVYDDLDRLTEIKDFHGTRKMFMDYEANGNIKLKSDWGDYFYGNQPIQPNAVKRISGDCCATRAACLEFDKCFAEQNIVYNAYNKPVSLMEGHYQMNTEYDVNGNRNYYELYEYPNEIFGPTTIKEMDMNTYPDIKSHTSNQFGSGILKKEKYYVGLFENIIDASKSSNIEYNYVMGPNGIFGVQVHDVNSNADNFYYFQYDFQGSIMALIDENGNIVNEYSYNAWGKRRNPYNWEEVNITYQPIQVNKFTGCWIPGIPPVLDPNQRNDEGPRLTADACTPDYGFIIDRGYIGQEHLDYFGLINLNARLYDPSIGRMLSPDNHVSDANNTQNYNRYSYALNNPLKYVDPDGNNPIAIAAVIISGVIGAYEGVKIAMSNGYNFSNWQTYLYMLGGAAIGTASGAIGSAVASGGFMSNTLAMLFSSYTSSYGMTVMSGGKVTPSLFFGFGSINLSTGKVNTIFSEGNSFGEVLGYAVGALANIADFLKGFNPGEAQVQTENRPQGSKDFIGHSQLLETDGKSLIDFGPKVPGDFLKFKKGRNDWISFSSDGRYNQIIDYQDNLTRTGQIVRGLNMNTIRKISTRLNNKPGFYNFLLRSCSSKVSRALTAAGLPVIGLHPYLLKLELSLINMGVRPFLSAHYLVNKK